jgi:hypothetical protein
VLVDFYAHNDVPAVLSLSYINTPGNGTVLTSSVQIPTAALEFSNDAKPTASVDLAGVVLNDKRKVVTTFKNRLSANQLVADEQADSSSLIYNHRVPLSPGIYQVRLAVRDNVSGKVGSAMDFIVIPDIAQHELTLSSLLLGGKVVATKSGSIEPQIQFSVDRRFARSDHLSFWVFVYNANQPNPSNDLTAKIEVLRQGQPIATSNQRISANSAADPSRIPFTGELALNNLLTGFYELRVTVSSNGAKSTASQSIGFEVQ